MVKESANLQTKLKALDPQVKNYISHIEKENTRLELEIAKLKLKQKALNLRVKALEKNQERPDLVEALNEARARAEKPTLHIHYVSEQTAAKVKEMEDKLGIPEQDRVSPTLFQARKRAA